HTARQPLGQVPSSTEIPTVWTVESKNREVQDTSPLFNSRKTGRAVSAMTSPRTRRIQQRKPGGGVAPPGSLRSQRLTSVPYTVPVIIGSGKPTGPAVSAVTSPILDVGIVGRVSLPDTVPEGSSCCCQFTLGSQRAAVR